MAGSTAAEVMAELEKRKREDPEFREQMEQAERERLERAREWRIAEQPVIDELRSKEIEVDSVWDLYNVPDALPRAIPVLLKHLALDYPDRVLEGIGQGLYAASARAFWDEIKDMLLTTDRDVVRDTTAAALSKCARREHYDDLVELVHNERLGSCRIYLLRPINRIGNRISAGKGRAVVESLAEDPVLGREATAILKGRSQSQ